MNGRMRAAVGLLATTAALVLVTCSGLAGRYNVSWAQPAANGWQNPLASLSSLVTDTAFNFDSPTSTYPSNHEQKRHAGIDLVAPPGTAVYAIDDGTIALIPSARDAIIVKHEGSRGPFFCVYGHIQLATGVSVGLSVSAGQKLGSVQQSAFPPIHLHFGINTSALTSTFMNDSRGLGWGRTAPRGASPAADPKGVGWTDPIVYLGSVRNAHANIPRSARTATVLVMDVSGSMGQSWEGGRKIDSAREAALQFIEHVEQENLVQGTEHWLAVVSFSGRAKVELGLTNNYAAVRQSILQLSPTSATNLGEGLIVGLQQVNSLDGQVQRYVTILSDGNTNTGPSESEILSGPVASARQANICINTVAFGSKSDVDEEFLRRIARGSGCGTYEYAATGFDLFAAYIKIRHHALGDVIDGLSSFGRRVTTLAGQSIALGTFSMPSGQRELQVTLGWSEAGRMQLRLFDPNGRQVTASYPGARIYSAGRFAQAIVSSPMRGIWRVDALPSATSLTGSQYFAIASTRPGGIAFALPVPVFSVGEYSFALPGNTPTWVLLVVSIACLAIAIYQLLAEAGVL